MEDTRGTTYREATGASASKKRQELCGDCGDSTRDRSTGKREKRLRVAAVSETRGASSADGKSLAAAHPVLSRKPPAAVRSQAEVAVPSRGQLGNDPSSGDRNAASDSPTIQSRFLRYASRSRAGSISRALMHTSRSPIPPVPLVEEPPSEDDDRACHGTATLAVLHCCETSRTSCLSPGCTETFLACPGASEPGANPGSRRLSRSRSGDARGGGRDTECPGTVGVTPFMCKSPKALRALRFPSREFLLSEAGTENARRHTTPTAVEEPLSDYQEEVTVDGEPL